MTSFEGIPNNTNNESSNSEVNQYKQFLDQKLETIKAELQTQSNEHTLKVFEEMQQIIEKGNENALNLYNESLERAKSLNSEMIRERSMRSAKKMYEMALEINQKLLDVFVKEFNISM